MADLHHERTGRRWALRPRGVLRVWLLCLAVLGLTLGSLSTDGVLAPVLMFAVLGIVLHVALPREDRVGGMRDWQQ